MRNKKKIMIYPCYFDVKRPRSKGRRVPKKDAVLRPMLDELRVIADHMKLSYDLDEEVVHPAAWWDGNPGRIMIKKKQDGEDLKKAILVKQFSKYLKAVKKKKKEKEAAKARHARYGRSGKGHNRYKK
ncbi:hypothetical protein GF325_16250 [Candidatus Bathyarchaeota archaeon]|nr:hypothetical protein [Candidatus Bathyarchaeota archaeon]